MVRHMEAGAVPGEELSTVRDEVEPQNIAPNDAMVFHQVIQRSEAVEPSDDTPDLSEMRLVLERL